MFSEFTAEFHFENSRHTGTFLKNMLFLFIKEFTETRHMMVVHFLSLTFARLQKILPNDANVY